MPSLGIHRLSRTTPRISDTEGCCFVCCNREFSCPPMDDGSFGPVEVEVEENDSTSEGRNENSRSVTTGGQKALRNLNILFLSSVLSKFRGFSFEELKPNYGRDDILLPCPTLLNTKRASRSTVDARTRTTTPPHATHAPPFAPCLSIRLAISFSRGICC